MSHDFITNTDIFPKTRSHLIVSSASQPRMFQIELSVGFSHGPAHLNEWQPCFHSLGSQTLTSSFFSLSLSFSVPSFADPVGSFFRMYPESNPSHHLCPKSLSKPYPSLTRIVITIFSFIHLLLLCLPPVYTEDRSQEDPAEA